MKSRNIFLKSAKNYSFLLLLFIYISIPPVLSQNLRYTKTFGNTGSNESISLLDVDEDNSLIAGGVANNSTTLDITDTLRAQYFDCLISKFDSVGNLLWSRALGGSGVDHIYALDHFLDNSIIVGGGLHDLINWVKDSTQLQLLDLNGEQAAFVAKISPTGNLNWIKTFEGNGATNYVTDVKISSDQKIYLTGAYRDSLDIDTNAAGFEIIGDGEGAFLMRMDSSGSVEWFRDIPAIASREFSLDLDLYENIYLTGHFLSSSVDFDLGPDTFNLSVYGNYDMFLAKYNKNSSFVWAYSIGSSGGDFSDGVHVDKLGNVAIYGSFRGPSIDADPTANVFPITQTGCEDAIYIRLDTTGSFEWAFTLTGSGCSRFKGLTTDDHQNMYFVGHYNNTIDFDPSFYVSNQTSAGSRDAFYLKVDDQNELQWYAKVSSAFENEANSVVTDKLANVYFGGSHMLNANYDDGDTIVTLIGEPAFVSDGFIVKVSSGESVPIITSTTTEEYFKVSISPNPTSQWLNVTSNDFIDRIVIYNNTGIKKLEIHPAQQAIEAKINVHNLLPGIYIAFIQTTSGLEKSKFLKLD